MGKFNVNAQNFSHATRQSWTNFVVIYVTAQLLFAHHSKALHIISRPMVRSLVLAGRRKYEK